MTIGWGAACVDGVVLASDSLVARHIPHADGDEIWAESRGDEKLRWLGDRVAYIVSGAFSAGPLLAAEHADPTRLVTTATSIFQELRVRRIVVPQLGRVVGMDLLMGGGPVGSAPQLLAIDDELGMQRMRRIPRGSVIEVGAMGRAEVGRVKPDRLRHIRDDLTTVEALGLAITSCHSYVREMYRTWGHERLGEFPGIVSPTREGVLPSFAFPLQVAVIAADEVRRYEVCLPGDLTDEDFASAKRLTETTVSTGA